MRLIKRTPNRMQRLSLFPAAPHLTLLNRRKPKPRPWPHATTTFTTRFTSDGVASTYRMHRVYQDFADILATMPHARGRCPSCHGTGRCPDCKGTGSTLVSRCVMCVGSGKCERCGGMVTRSDESPLDWLRSVVRRLRGKPPFEGV